MRAILPRALLRVACMAAVLMVPAVASAESVTYIDGNEVWASTVDGARKVRISGGENQWRDVANATNGSVVGVKLEGGKIAQLSFFSQWDPNGALIRSGILPNAHVGWSLATPLNLDVTADGGAMVWGYSALLSGFPTSTLAQGAYFSSTQNVGGLAPLTMSGEEWPSLAGNRLVSVTGRAVRVMNAVPSAPFSNQAADFADWLNLAGVLDASWDLHTAVTSASGNVVAFHLSQFTGGTQTGARIGVVGTGGLGSPLTGAPDCWLPAVGLATSEPSISDDGTLIAWQDAEGVKVAPVPTGAGDPCTFSSPPVIISATGKEPDLGGFAVPAAVVAPVTTPVTTTPRTTSITTPAAAAASVFVARGITLKVRPATTGKVLITVSVPGRAIGLPSKKTVVIARATRTVAAGALSSFVIKPLAKYRAKVKKLKGKRVTVRITVGGKVTVRTIRLR